MNRTSSTTEHAAHSHSATHEQTIIRVLLVEDCKRDAELIAAALAADGLVCRIERVENAADFSAALRRGAVDVILSDYHLPRFDGLSALTQAKQISPDVPFLFVSGALGEELAIETLKLGATDYVLKDRLSKVGPAVRRARAEAEERAVRQAAEARLRQAEKMEVVGRLTASVAHDFNNLLTIINGFSDLLLRRISEDDPSCRAVRMIRNAGDRGTALIQRLLAFSRNQVHQPRVVHLETLLGELRQLLESLLGPDIRLEMRLGSASYPVEVDPLEIEQMILNLAANARDAMLETGHLVLEMSQAVLVPDEAAIFGLVPGEYAVVRMSDTGTGMDELTRSRIFEPFFTTKALGKGAGLGLWSVREAVARYQGAILVDSAPGEGATFRVYLPLSDKGAADVAPLSMHSDSLGPVLVVDDVAEIREMMGAILEEAGYRVLTAASGADALALAASEPQEIPLVLVDIRMPGMSGPAMVEELRLLRPQIRVCFLSGYSDYHPLEVPFLAKPFTRESLLNAVENLYMLQRR